jgi:hypothetical protein
MAAVTIAVGSPYVWATHHLTNKPSIHQWLGKELPQLDVEPGKPQNPQTSLDAGLTRKMACIFGITLDLQTSHGRRAVQAVWGMFGELGKCFHYLAWPPVILGMWWYRSRMWDVPGMWILLVLCGLSVFGLWRLAVEVGYMSDRHLMILVMCSCYAAAAAVWELPGRFWQWYQTKRAQATAESRANLRPPLAMISVALLCVMIVMGLPKSLQRLHGNRAGHHAAGLWLAEHSAPSDVIEDDHCWAHYYAGRVFQERHPLPWPEGHERMRYVVIGRRDREVIPMWNSPPIRDEEKLRDEGGRIVYHWPVPSNPAEASIVVYAVPASGPVE